MAMMNGGDLSDVDDEVIEDVREPFVFEDRNHHAHILNSLNTMRKNRIFCDVILHVGTAELYGHRAVLASVSPQLMELFQADDEETNGKTRGASGSASQGHVVHITMNTNVSDGHTHSIGSLFDVRSLEKLIDYAYTSRLDLDGNEVRSVYLTSCYLKMHRVAEQCAKHLIKHLTVDNCIEIRSLPGFASNTIFSTSLDCFITANFEKIQQSSSFLSLPCIQIEVLSQSRQEIGLAACDSLCKLVMDWIKRTYSSSKTPFSNFVEKTHMLYLAMDNSLQDCSEMPTGDVSDTQIVQEYKKMSKKPPLALSPNGQRMGQMQSAKPRVLIYNTELADSSPVNSANESNDDSDWLIIATSKVADRAFLSLVMLDDCLTRLSIVLRLNTVDEPPSASPTMAISADQRSVFSSQESIPDTYCSLANMSAAKCAAGCTAINDRILVCGGYDRIECLRTVESYDPVENAWQSLASMTEARGRFGIAVACGNVYAVGGSNGTTELATVECYDGDRWTLVAPLAGPRSNAGVCTLSNKVYCIGGWNEKVGIRHCDVYDPELNKWTSIAPLLTGRYQAGVCAFNGMVYAVGGCSGWNCLNSVEYYNPETNTWSSAKPLITARRGCGLTEFNGKLVAVGGCDGSSSLDSVEILDPVTGDWRLGPNMMVPRSNVGVAVLNDCLYAVGGFSGKKFLHSMEYLDDSINKWTSFVQKSNCSSTATSMHEDELKILNLGAPNKWTSFVQESNFSSTDTSMHEDELKNI